MRVREGEFEIGPHGCTLPSALVVGYALSIASAAGAAKILMAGFDGYGAGDPRQEEMLQLLELYGHCPAAAPLTAVTATTYPIRQSSIYSPEI